MLKNESLVPAEINADLKNAFDKLHDMWNEERSKNSGTVAVKPKHFRKPLDKDKLSASIKKHPRSSGGTNWTLVGKDLGVDPETAKNQAINLNLVKPN